MSDDLPPDNEPTRRDDVEGEGAIRGTARMEAFADAVFAIALTLPVVHIELPHLEVGGSSLREELGRLAPSYVGYVLAATVIGLYFVRHHFSGAIFRSTGHWFLTTTIVFLAAIAFIAFPARVFAEHFADPAARPDAARFWVVSLAMLSLAWLLKWSVGVTHGHLDERLEPDYVRRLTRHCWIFVGFNIAAAVIVFWHWQAGFAISAAAIGWMLFPPGTPRYVTEAPVIEGET